MALICAAALAAGAVSSGDCELPRYTVAAGDTLWGLSGRFGTSVSALAYANDIADADLIHVGQELQVYGLQDPPPDYVPYRGLTERPSAPLAHPTPARAEPTATPTVQVSGARVQVPETALQATAVAAGWPAGLASWVERTALCESGGNTGAVSPEGYQGLMQVAPWLHGSVPQDAVGQLAQAYGVYLKQGAGAWPVCGLRG